MTLRAHVVVLCAVLIMGGCAGSPIKPVALTASADPAPLATELEAYNLLPPVVKVVGTLRLEGLGATDYGARVEAARGVRLDIVTGMMARLIMSASCEEGEGCQFYLPERNTLYRERGRWAGSWLSALVAGRVPVMGKPESAWLDSLGRSVLRLTDEEGNWQLVVFSAEGPLPEVVQYGRGKAPASVEISYGDFFRQADRWFPGRVVLLGEDSDEGASFEPLRVKFDGAPLARSFSLRLPEGVRIVEDGESIWRRLGLLWTP
jgi:hypothetical protein